MYKIDEKSNAQGWELEIVCKDKQYLDAVVNAMLKYGVLNFQVECVDVVATNEWDGRYIVLIWCHWFSNLQFITNDLAKIEEEREGFADVPKTEA